MRLLRAPHSRRLQPGAVTASPWLAYIDVDASTPHHRLRFPPSSNVVVSCVRIQTLSCLCPASQPICERQLSHRPNAAQKTSPPDPWSAKPPCLKIDFQRLRSVQGRCVGAESFPSSSASSRLAAVLSFGAFGYSKNDFRRLHAFCILHISRCTQPPTWLHGRRC